MKKRMAALLITLAVVAAACWGYVRYAGENQGSVLEVTGTIEATQVELRAKLPGTLHYLLDLRAGTPVARDQVVAVIVRNDLVAQRERDALAVLKARAQLADLTSGAREQEIREAEVALRTAEVNYEQAARDHARAVTLHQEQAIPASEMEKAETALKLAANQVEAAKARLGLLRAGSRPEQVAAARAELERSVAVLKASEALLEDTKIVCPIDGTVLTRNFEEGEYVTAGASVATVANLNDMWIKVYIPTDDLPRIRLGQQVRFTVSGSPNTYTGVIEEIASRGEFTPKTVQTKKERANIVYAVKIRIDNANGVLKPGMPADVVID